MEESEGAYASLGTRQEGGSFEDVGLSVYASPLRILVLRFRRTEFRQSAVGPKVSGGIRETEEGSERLRRWRSLWEVFNVIFELRSCPLSIQRLYTTTVGT